MGSQEWSPSTNLWFVVGQLVSLDTRHSRLASEELMVSCTFRKFLFDAKKFSAEFFRFFYCFFFFNDVPKFVLFSIIFK